MGLNICGEQRHGYFDRLVRAVWKTSVILLLATTSGLARAQMPVSASPDITVELGPSNLLAHDEDIVVDNLLGIVVLENLGSLPSSTAITAYGQMLDGTRLMAFDTSVDLGSVIAHPGDVVGYDGATYSLVFDASASGVPAGAHTDATSISFGGLLLSFDIDAQLSGHFVADEDLVRWDGSTFTQVFNGAAAGLGREHDVDAAQDLGGGAFLVSLETTGSVGGVIFADEDIVRYENGTWTLEFDGSQADADWGQADLEALMVPEPGTTGSLVAGLLLLACSIRGRRSIRVRPVAGLVLFVGLCVVANSTEVRAADGQWEINQVCAEQTGCFPGDVAGFPVTISQSGSYVLTSNIAVSTVQPAIAPTVGDITLDLGGFELAGPVTCTGTGSTLLCDGIDVSGIAGAAAPNVRVFNGFVRGFGFNGIAVGSGGQVHDVTVYSNGTRGIWTGTHSTVRDVIVYRNGGSGIVVSAGSLVAHAYSAGNRLDGITATAGATLVSNLVENNGDDGVSTSASAGGALIQGNLSRMNESTGIEAAGAGSMINANLCVLSTFSGIHAVSGASVLGNESRENGTFGVRFSGTGSTYHGNDFGGNGSGAILGTALDQGNNQL